MYLLGCLKLTVQVGWALYSSFSLQYPNAQADARSNQVQTIKHPPWLPPVKHCDRRKCKVKPQSVHFPGFKLISQDIFGRGSMWNFERGYVHRSVSPVFFWQTLRPLGRDHDRIPGRAGRSWCTDTDWGGDASRLGVSQSFIGWWNGWHPLLYLIYCIFAFISGLVGLNCELGWEPQVTNSFQGNLSTSFNPAIEITIHIKSVYHHQLVILPHQSAFSSTNEVAIFPNFPTSNGTSPHQSAFSHHFSTINAAACGGEACAPWSWQCRGPCWAASCGSWSVTGAKMVDFTGEHEDITT